MKKTLLSVLSMATVISACTNNDVPVAEGPQHGDAGKALLEKIEKIAASDTYMYGHQDTYMYGISWTLAEEEFCMVRSDIFDVCGQYPAVNGIELGGIELGDARSIDSNDFNQMRLAAQIHHERGGINTLSWHPRNPLTEGDAWDVSSNQVVKSILEGGEKHEKFMTWLSRLADYLLTFTDSEGNQIPMIFRPWHEHSGSWFWWGTRLCTEQEYKDLWIMTYDYLVNERGLENLLWTMSPNAPISVEEYESRYPGDEYVDIIGFDNYCHYTKGGSDEQIAKDFEQFKGIMEKNLPELAAMGEKHGKTIAITETGLQELGYNEFWTGLGEIIKPYPISYVLTWRNERGWVQAGHFFGPYPEGPSADDFKEWVAAPEVLMVNDIK